MFMLERQRFYVIWLFFQFYIFFSIFVSVLKSKSYKLPTYFPLVTIFFKLVRTIFFWQKHKRLLYQVSTSFLFKQLLKLLVQPIHREKKTVVPKVLHVMAETFVVINCPKVKSLWRKIKVRKLLAQRQNLWSKDAH